jgi:hypothetical protein
LEDGGYYAIKGFSFQFIKSIQSILDSKTLEQKFTLENKQDFNSDTIVYQMKYKEKSKYLPSNLKEPVIKILNDYKKEKCKYVLYAYFYDRQNEQISFDSVYELDKILLNCKIGNVFYKFENELKESFIKDFKIVLSKEYILEMKEAIDKIGDTLNCDFEVAEIYYPQVIGLFINIITQNSPVNRVITKKEIIEYLKLNRDTIIHDFYIRNKKNKEYIKFIKDNFFKERTLNNHERFFIFNFSNYSKVEIQSVIYSISKKYYKLQRINKDKYMLISPPPYIYIQNIDENLLKEIKREMYGSCLKFNDGYPFKGAIFDVENIVKANSRQDDICFKIIDNINDLKSVLTKLSNKVKKVYNFYSDTKLDINIEDLNYVKIDNIRNVIDIMS